MNTGANHAAAFSHGAQGRWHQRTDRRVNDGGVQRNRGQFVRSFGPSRAEGSRQSLRLDIALARECIDRASLPARHLGDDMPGGTETVDAEMPAVSGHDQGTPADQARAEQRRDRGGVARFAERKAVTGIGDKVRDKATVARVAREQRTIAKIFLTTPAIGAFAAGVTASQGTPTRSPILTAVTPGPSASARPTTS